jgi:hypothetical protein
VTRIRQFAAAHRWLWTFCVATIAVVVALTASVAIDDGEWSWSLMFPAAAIYIGYFAGTRSRVRREARNALPE